MNPVAILIWLSLLDGTPDDACLQSQTCLPCTPALCGTQQANAGFTEELPVERSRGKAHKQSRAAKSLQAQGSWLRVGTDTRRSPWLSCRGIRRL